MTNISRSRNWGIGVVNDNGHVLLTVKEARQLKKELKSLPMYQQIRLGNDDTTAILTQSGLGIGNSVSEVFIEEDLETIKSKLNDALK